MSNNLTICLTLAILALCLVISGCAAWENLVNDPDTATYVNEVGEGVWGVAANPFSIPAWVKIVGGLVGLGGVAFGTKKAVVKYRSRNDVPEVVIEDESRLVEPPAV